MRTLSALILLQGIHLYRAIGKLLGLSSPCRFYPTCSVYAEQAIQSRGPFLGGKAALGRLLRCHPWNPGGIDLPETENG